MQYEQIKVLVLALIIGCFILMGLIFLVGLWTSYIWEYVKAFSDDHEARIKKLEGKDDTEEEARG